MHQIPALIVAVAPAVAPEARALTQEASLRMRHKQGRDLLADACSDHGGVVVGVALAVSCRHSEDRKLSAICKLAHEICGPRFFPF